MSPSVILHPWYTLVCDITLLVWPPQDLWCITDCNLPSKMTVHAFALTASRYSQTFFFLIGPSLEATSLSVIIDWVTVTATSDPHLNPFSLSHKHTHTEIAKLSFHQAEAGTQHIDMPWPFHWKCVKTNRHSLRQRDALGGRKPSETPNGQLPTEASCHITTANDHRLRQVSHSSNTNKKRMQIIRLTHLH